MARTTTTQQPDGTIVATIHGGYVFTLRPQADGTVLLAGHPGVHSTLHNARAAAVAFVEGGRDKVATLEDAGLVSPAVAQAMRETAVLTAEACATCDAGRGRWCDHRAAAAPYRTLAGLVGTMPHGSVEPGL
jgi:hypothetical protein